MRINCFDKIKHKEVQSLQDVFFSRVPENTELSEQEQKEIGKEIVMQYYGELNNKINALKQGINPNVPTSEIPDTSGQKKAMEDLYNGLIQKETEGIEQVKKEQDEKSKFQNQTPADQIQIIKAAEIKGEAAISSGNEEAIRAAINDIDSIIASASEKDISDMANLKTNEVVKDKLFDGDVNAAEKFETLPDYVKNAVTEMADDIASATSLKNHVVSALDAFHSKEESGIIDFNEWATLEDPYTEKVPVDVYSKSDLAFAKNIDHLKTQKEVSDFIKDVKSLMEGTPDDLISDEKSPVSFEDALHEKNVMFSMSEPTSEEIEDMKDVIADLVDEGTLRLSEIQDYVANELEDNSQEMRDLVATAYHEYGKDKESTPIEVTKGVIGRIGQFLSNLFGGTAGEKIFIAKDSESLKRKAERLTGIKIMLTPDGSVLGFTHDGKIYLDGSRINPATALHESSHLWTEWVEKNSPDVYNAGIQKIIGSQYLTKVQANKFYQQEANKLPQNERTKYYQHEALAMAIGDRGAQFVTEAKRSGFKEWLKNLWDTIAKAVGFKDVTADELSSMTLDEFSKRAAAEILKGEQLQAQEKEYEKNFDDNISNYEMTSSEEVNRMLSGKTVEDVFGEAPEGDQYYYVQKKVDMLQDGMNMIGVAQGMWGTDLNDYGKPLLNYIKNMGNDAVLTNKKAVLLATFLGQIKEEMLRRPERVNELKKLNNDVTEYYQKYMNIRGKEVAAGALLRFYRDKYMGDIFVNKILEEAQIREQKRIRNAQQDINVNEVSEEAFTPVSKEEAQKEDAVQKQAEAKKSKSGKPKMSQRDAEKMAAAKMEEIKNKGGLKDMIDKVKAIIDKLNCK